jgi:hypothetical protein
VIAEVPVEIRPYHEGDEHAILAVFGKVFPWARRSLEEWRWQYRDNPLGVHVFVGVLPDGSVVSQYAGIPRRVKVGDEIRTFAEMVDSLSDPEFRQGLKKPGLFGRTLNRYVGHFGHPDRETVMYGLPNPQAYRIGSRFFNYNLFHEVQGLDRDLSAAGLSLPAEDLAGGSFEEVADIPPDADALWKRIEPQFDVATVRDREYLHWRFAARPHHPYRIHALRERGGELAGMVVLRHDWLRAETGVRTTAVAEWLVVRDRPLSKALPALIEGIAHGVGAERVRYVFRPGSEEWRHLAGIGYVPQSTGFRLVGGTYDHAAVPLRRLVDHWYFTLGDFDVV